MYFKSKSFLHNFYFIVDFLQLVEICKLYKQVEIYTCIPTNIWLNLASYRETTHSL